MYVYVYICIYIYIYILLVLFVVVLFGPCGTPFELDPLSILVDYVTMHYMIVL